MCRRIVAARLVGLLVAGWLICGWSAEALGETMRYEWKPGQKFSYRIAIKVDHGDGETSYTGIANYTVNLVDDLLAQLTYSGGLSESKKAPQAGRPDPFGPRGFGSSALRSFPGPFGKPSFKGTHQTTNKISISPRGKVLSMEGDSQLPYLLGNVSELPFEVLPAGNEQTWSFESGISISEGREDHFGGFDPFGRRTSSAKLQTAAAETRYRIQAPQGDAGSDFVKVDVEYGMRTPDTPGNASFTMTGKGVWTFDQKDHVPQALQMQYELIIKQNNVTATVPISLKYDRISEEELAQMEAEATRRAAERAAADAEAKALAEAPLTGEERAAALRSLTGGSAVAAKATLKELAKKSPLDADEKITAAIERLIKNPDPDVREEAERALVKWSPSFKRWKELEKKYEGPSPVDSSGREVLPRTPLTVGQVVQAKQNSNSHFWFPARVDQLLRDGTVRVGFLTWGEVKRSEVVARSQIQLPPLEFVQGQVDYAIDAVPERKSSVTRRLIPPAASAAPSPEPSSVAEGTRTWSDASGKFKVEAELVSVNGANVTIRRASDGTEITLPIAKLSPADQSFVAQSQSDENPFGGE